jgi:ApbE superfamily uncharacterized protein (UPF0280 family)
VTARQARLPDGRLHLSQGPMDLVIAAYGLPDEVEAAYAQAWAHFPPILPELAAELPCLRRPVEEAARALQGRVARRMAESAWPFRRRFITPMAAVAGAVAEDVLAAMLAGRSLRRAYVNNGGDIALHLAPGERFAAGVVADVSSLTVAGRAEIAAADPVRGIATSGWAGRSFSLGIADAVTVLAPRAGEADAAATLIANAVTVDHPAVRRRPARSLDPDSDLGERPVTVAVGPLGPAAAAAALEAGAAVARELADAGLILAAMLQLQGQSRIVTADGYRDPKISVDGRGDFP